MPKHYVLGTMSGSSLDGLDLAICRFDVAEGKAVRVTDWSIVAATTVAFTDQLRRRLIEAPRLSGYELMLLDADLGDWIGRTAKRFLRANPTHPVALIGSHGHTIFHAPESGFTTQIGDGALIAGRTGIATVTQLRGADVASGGQGAPLAPLADKHLFPVFAAHLNLGGIVNLSVRTATGAYLAGDVSGCCQVLDRLARRAGKAYDADGSMARSGALAPALAPKLAALPYHELPYPKSLDNGWVRDELWPLLDRSDIPTEDLLYTFTKWLAQKVTGDLTAIIEQDAGADPDKVRGERAGAKVESRRVMLAGGGSRNRFLVDSLRATQDAARPSLDFYVPDAQTIDFKEAALIALAALLRRLEKPNALPSSTGASRPTVNGALYHP